MDLVVGECMPLRIVESNGFRRFLQKIDKQYKPLSRQDVKKRIGEKAGTFRKELTEILASVDNVNLTVGIWSDRKMRSFLRITIHIMETKDGQLSLKTHTLSCQRFVGKHSGERIGTAFEAVLEEFKVKNKVDYVITDNASNMKSAFTATFPDSAEDADDDTLPDESESTAIPLDDKTMWLPLEEQEQQKVDNALYGTAKKTRLSCLKETKGIRPAMSKASRITTLLHTSSAFKDAFKEEFGTDRSISAANSTRWNSVLRQMSAITSLDQQKLSNACQKTDHSEAVLTVREWGQLKELVDVLSHFSEARNLTQGDKVPTVSLVIPTVLALNQHLLQFNRKVKYLRPLIAALTTLSQRHFLGIFTDVGMSLEPQELGNAHPFGEMVYVIAAVLDPTFGFRWLIDVTKSEKEKAVLRTKIKDLVAQEAGMMNDDVPATDKPSEEDDEPPSKLFVNYRRNRHSSSGAPKTAATQIVRYLEETEEVEDPCLQFWSVNSSKCDALFSLAKLVLTVPASSAPVELVFSQGALIMRPHRCRLGDKLLSDLVFLKCNLSHIVSENK